MAMDQEPDLSEPPYMPTPEEEKAEAWEYWHQRARKFEDALQAIASMSEEEIKARFGGHPNKTAEELGRNSAIYHLLIMPGNIARSALAQDEGAKR